MSRASVWLRRIAAVLAAVVGLAAAVTGSVLVSVHASVPRLDGRMSLAGLGAPLTVRRDERGTAVLQGRSRLDVARALGFVHAQERFFEMDLARRSAAGELAALFGPRALERDKVRRLQRLRPRLLARLSTLEPSERALLQAYAEGVNAGLARLGTRPWQYMLLQARPQPWQPVDSLLVVGEMYWMLQGSSLEGGFERAWLRERVGEARFAWLEPRGGHWDAALDGSQMQAPALPGPDLFDTRAPGRSATAGPLPGAMQGAEAREAEEARVGSNQWAVAGALSGSGGAMLANDMHLGLGAPALWFRAQFEYGQGADAVRAAGVTLPGLPALVAGSNGAVAWGFTNAYGQWFDWVRLPSGPLPGRLVQVRETIAVKDAPGVALDVAEFDGAPVVRTVEGTRYALRWVAQQPEAYTLALDQMLGAADVGQALAIAHRCGMPQQNIMLADRAGHVAWTIAGRLWAGSREASWARFLGPEAAPPAWLAPEAVPVRADPADGRLWTANNRTLGGRTAEVIGDGGFDLGARAQQIRDRLREGSRFDEAALGAVQLDDEARFMRAWAGRVAAAIDTSPRHAEALAVLKAWDGRADADQAAYRLVRGVRLRTLDALWNAWAGPWLGPGEAGTPTHPGWHARFEYSAALAVDERPLHLLPRPFDDWDAFLRAQVDAVVDEMTSHGQRALADAVWGEANASRIGHVLAHALPPLAPLLDMPSLPQGGDSNLPHVSGPAFGQSERLVVAPGHEERATLAMPGGQSGHPMSPYYGAGHQDWVEHRPTPLLAGHPEHTLLLVP